MTAENRVAPVILGFIALLEADAELIALFGGTPFIRQRNSVQAVQTIPGIYWSIITQSLRENAWSAFVEWDVWAESYGAAVAISDRLTAVMHRENAVRTVNNVALISVLTDVEEGPDEGDGTMRLINIFHYQPMRAITGA